MNIDLTGLGTLILALATAILVFLTRKILIQQKRGVEYEIKPLIGIRHEATETKKLQCVISRNDAFNISMTVSINGKSSTQELGCVLLSSDPDHHVPYTYSEEFNLQKLLDSVEPDSKVTLEVCIEYDSISGAKWTEKYVWKDCLVTEKGIRIKPRTKTPISRELITAP